MSSDFNLDKSRWFNVMKVGMACDHIKPCIDVITQRTPNLSNFSYEPVIGEKLAKAEEQLTAALDAIRAAREEFEIKTRSVQCLSTCQ